MDQLQHRMIGQGLKSRNKKEEKKNNNNNKVAAIGRIRCKRPEIESCLVRIHSEAA